MPCSWNWVSMRSGFEGDQPPLPKRIPEFRLADGVGAGFQALVAHAEQMQRGAGLGDRSQARHVARSLVGVEGVEQPTVEHGVERASQPLQFERIGGGEFDSETACLGLLAGHGQRRFRDLDAQHRQAQGGQV